MTIKSASPYLRIGIWIIAVALGDQLTKWWVRTSFSPFEIKPVVPGFFNLTYLRNTGAAFGLFGGDYHLGRQVFFVTVGAAAVIGLLIAVRRLRLRGLCQHAVGLILGGTIGNLIDRLAGGSVVDFLDFYVKGWHWPAFNVADSAITVGAGLFVLGSLFLPPAQD